MAPVAGSCLLTGALLCAWSPWSTNSCFHWFVALFLAVAGVDFWLLRPPRWFAQRRVYQPPGWQFSFRDWLIATLIFGLCVAWLSAMIEYGPPRL